jgi:hypothetical protein
MLSFVTALGRPEPARSASTPTVLAQTYDFQHDGTILTSPSFSSPRAPRSAFDAMGWSPAASTPQAELARLRAAAIGLTIGFGLIGLSVASHLASPLAAGLSCIFLSVVLAILRPGYAPIVLIVTPLFQSLFIAFVSPWMSEEGFETARGYSFLIAASVWIVAAIRWLLQGRSAPKRLRRRVGLSLVAFALVGFYFVFGLARGVDPRSAVIYLRNVGLPLMMMQTGYALGWRGAPSFLTSLQMLAWIVLGLGLFEAAQRDAWLNLTHGDVYWSNAMRDMVVSGFTERVTKLSGSVPATLKDYFLVNLFNSSEFKDLDLKVYRVNGPNHHPISYAYAITFLSLVMATNGRWLFVAASIPLMLLVGSKGALLVFLVGLFFPLAARKVRSDALVGVCLAGLALFLASAIISGRNSGDFHVLGMLGGVYGFLENPIGRGLGFGGNLSEDFVAIDWAKAQAAGATDVAVESAVGVALFQLGVAGIFILGLFAHLALSCWRAYQRDGDRMLALCCFALLAVLSNSLLQEEAAFSPLALGILAFLAAMRVAGADAREEARGGP